MALRRGPTAQDDTNRNNNDTNRNNNDNKDNKDNKDNSNLFHQFRLKRDLKNSPSNYPVENKFLVRMGNLNFKVALCDMQGRRELMEDAHCIILDLENHKGCGLFGIFDGHEGYEVSRYCAGAIAKKLDQCKEFSQEEITAKFMELDEELGDKNSGSTCTLVILDTTKPHHEGISVTAINLGDSRSFIATPESPGFKVLTVDHKPDVPSEAARIEGAGGQILRKRIDSSLAVSRAFGDKQYKANPNLPKDKQKVICVPDVTSTHLATYEYIFMCCDGIFEHFSNEGAINFINDQFKETKDTALILSNLLTATLKGGSRDNMTAMIIELTPGTEYTKPQEFIPGKFYANGNETFVSGYKLNCEQHGLIWEEIEKNLPRSDELESPDMKLSTQSQPSLVPEKGPIGLSNKNTRTTQSVRNLNAKIIVSSELLPKSEEEGKPEIEKKEPEKKELEKKEGEEEKKKKKKGLLDKVMTLKKKK